MGMSANQARFLSLTSRQVDLEYRMQQICHRRLRLSSELEKIATNYNNAMSDRKLFASNQTMYEGLSIKNLNQLGYRLIGSDNGVAHPNLVSTVQNTNYTGEVYEVGSVADLQAALVADGDLNGTYVLTDNIDMSSLGTLNQSFINGTFNGTFDGNGYEIQNLDISAAGGTDNLGFISRLGASGSVQNVVFKDSSITVGDGTSGNLSRYIGTVAGYAEGDINNVAVINSEINAGDYAYEVGGLTGLSDTNDISNINMDIQITTGYHSRNVGGISGFKGGEGTLTDSFANVDITVGDVAENIGGVIGGGWIATGTTKLIEVTNNYVQGSVTVGDGSYDSGGFAGTMGGGVLHDHNVASVDVTGGDNCYDIGAYIGMSGSAPNTISNSMATGNVTTGNNSYNIAGFIGVSDAVDSSLVTNSISTGTVTSGTGSNKVAGFVGESSGLLDAMMNSYTTSTVTAGAGSTNVFGFSGIDTSGTIDNTNYYENNLSTTASNAVNANITPAPSSITSIANLPEPFETVGVEEGLRNGTYSLAREADSYSQNPFDISGTSYEEVDWRIVPTIDDDLYAANDTEAETEYEAAIEKINSQDKKLQLEQSQVEVEHKAIITQKDAVKNILNKNIESSFKTFS